jgi:hypothetical protein
MRTPRSSSYLNNNYYVTMAAFLHLHKITGPFEISSLFVPMFLCSIKKTDAQ